MNKNSSWIIGIIALTTYISASCSDDVSIADPNSDWAVSNAAYLDSIANVMTSPPPGETWLRYMNYKIQYDDLDVELITSNTDYIYIKDLTEEGTELGNTPLSTDTVYVHYRGWLINGTVFDESYTDDWNPEIHVPSTFIAGNLITGWTTALLHMQEGEHWEIYIPYTMGYGTSDYSSIPAYSTLVFDLRLEEVRHPIGPDDESRSSSLPDSIGNGIYEERE